MSSPSGMTSMKVRSKAVVAAQKATMAVELVVVDALQRHGVQLHLASPASALAAKMPSITLSKLAPAGDRLELVGIQRVDRDVDPAHARDGMQLLGEARQLAAVGGQRQLFERAVGRHVRQPPAQALDQRHHVATHQRLAAGQPQLLDPEPDERAAQPVKLLQRQQVPLRQERHVLRMQ